MSSEEHKALFERLSTHLDAIFIVIEALDEFSLKHDDQYQLMDTLISLRNAVNESSPGRLRLLVTCRPMNGMLKEMRPASSINMRPPDVVSLSAPAHQETDAAASGKWAQHSWPVRDRFAKISIELSSFELMLFFGHLCVSLSF